MKHHSFLPRTLLALLLVLTLAVSLFPMAAWAEMTVDDNESGTVDVVSGEIMNNNYATVISNEGTVTNNYNFINSNETTGTVTNNNAGGEVTSNFGTVTTNYAASGDKEAGLVKANHAGGIVTDNYGTVENNNRADVANGKPAGLVVTNHEGALVRTNNGTVTTNEGTIGTTDEQGEPLSFTGNFGTVGTNTSTGTITANHADGTVTDNQDGGTIMLNEGMVTTNSGTIGQTDENGDPVNGTGNYGTVVTNQSGGTITTNKRDGNRGGVVETNNGTITDNYGHVGIKDEQGLPADGTGNSGTITNNYRYVVANNADGIIANNFDAVDYNYGTIENNTGSVIFNYGTVVNNYGDGEVYAAQQGDIKGTVTNQYSYGVQFTGDNAAAEGGDLSLFAGVYWLKDNTEGSVTVKPKSGYTLDMPTLAEGANAAMTATGSERGGWTLNFTSLLENVSLLLNARLIPQQPGAGFDSSLAVANIGVLQLIFEDGFGAVAALSVPQGKPFTLPDAPEHEGFRFLGWEAEIDGESVVFDAGARIKLDQAVTLRALWAPTVGNEAAMKLAIRES